MEATDTSDEATLEKTFNSLNKNNSQYPIPQPGFVNQTQVPLCMLLLSLVEFYVEYLLCKKTVMGHKYLQLSLVILRDGKDPHGTVDIRKL